jgi:hypothetical protein
MRLRVVVVVLLVNGVSVRGRGVARMRQGTSGCRVGVSVSNCKVAPSKARRQPAIVHGPFVRQRAFIQSFTAAAF